MELSDAFAEGGVQIPSPNPRWKQASRTGFEPKSAPCRPERNPSSTFWLVYGREAERALPSAE